MRDLDGTHKSYCNRVLGQCEFPDFTLCRAGLRTGLEPASAPRSESGVPSERQMLRTIATFFPPRRPGVRGPPAASNLWSPPERICRQHLDMPHFEPADRMPHLKAQE